MDDEYIPRREAGGRVTVLFSGLVIGALVMTAVWVGIAGNPLSDDNEVAYSQITVADVSAEGDTLCWSEDPRRRDAAQLCAILALDRVLEVPRPGDTVVIGLVMLAPPDRDPVRQIVFVGPPDPSAEDFPATPAPTGSD